MHTCHGENCNSIAANIYVNESWLRVCPVCGMAEQLTDEEKIPDQADIIAGNAYVKALEMEYDTAEELFRKAYLLSGDEDLQPGYLWWAVKCCFGIEYVKELTYENDPERRSCQYTPTSARFPFNQEALTGSETLELFDEYLAGHPNTELSKLYSKMLQLYQEIDDVCRDTRNHCDVFIAWHDREDSRRCQGCAGMLRNWLNGAGKHCFVSFSNLSGKSVWHYEAYIYAALASAKAFIIVIDDYDALGRKFLGSEVRRMVYRKLKHPSLEIVFVGMEGHTGSVPPVLNGVHRHYENFICTEDNIQHVGEQVVSHLPENDSEPSDMRTCRKFDYYLLDDGSAEITAYRGNAWKINVPDTLDGTRVTSIGDSAFNLCGMRSIRLPEGLERIGNFAFSGCSSLVNVDLPDSVREIHDDAFEGCSKLTRFNIPAGVESLGIRAFCGCHNLGVVEMPDTLTAIPAAAFEACSSLTQINIPTGVESLGIRAFEGCASLTQIDIPDSVVSIGIDAFRSCSRLTRITAPRHLASFFPEALQGIITYRDAAQPEPPAAEPAQEEPPAVEPVQTEPPADMSASDPADFDFKEQDNHEAALIGYHGESAEVVIPDSVGENRVTYIGFNAFANCGELKAVHIPNSVTSIGRYAFAGCGELARIHISDSITNIGMGTFMGCASLQEISIPDSVTKIGRSAFAGCASLLRVHISERAQRISGYAFYGCASLEEVNIPDSATSIGCLAFNGCGALTCVHIPGTITSIGTYAFANCESLPEISIPDSVIQMGKYALANCRKLTDIRLSEKLASISEGAFVGCASLTRLRIPNSVTSIGDCAFQWCDALTSLRIPDGVTEIGDYAFRDCGALKEVSIPRSVTSLGHHAFEGCENLTRIEAPRHLAECIPEALQQALVFIDDAPVGCS